jgi:hypothetical protein
MTDGRRTPSDGKNSPGFWPGELKMIFLFIVEIITQTKSGKNLKCYDVATGKTKWILQCSSEEEFSINCIEVIYIYVIFYQNIPNLHNRYKSAERKISQKRRFKCESLRRMTDGRRTPDAK